MRDSDQGHQSFAWVIWVLVLLLTGSYIVWNLYYSNQASFTTLLSGVEGQRRYDIRKVDKSVWTLAIDGTVAAGLEETNDAAPRYAFRVKTSTVEAPAAGMVFEIGVAGSSPQLFCHTCAQPYLKLPTYWSRVE